jgi:hypothetical protein
MRSTDLALALASLLLTACGGSDGGSGGTVDTGLPENQKLSSLNDADVQKACTSWSASFSATFSASELQRVQCTADALAASAPSQADQATLDVDKCNTLVAACVKQVASNQDSTLSAELVDENECKSSQADDSLKACDATVAEYEACASAVIDEIKQRLSQVQCSAGATLDDNAETGLLDFDVSDLPACKTFRTKCPDVQLGSTSDDGDDAHTG